VDFGRVDDLERVDWRLPEDADLTGPVLAASPDSDTEPDPSGLRIRIGAPRWGVKAWEGRIYPKAARSAEYLAFYARHFTAVELNATFYQIPSENTINRWREMVPDRFRFCPKVPQRVSHSAGLDPEGGMRQRFFDAVGGLGDRLGPCFLMLPARFAPERVSELERFLDALPEDIRLSVEFRHPGFFQPATMEKTFSMLRNRNVGTVITDTAGRRDAVHMGLTTPSAFIRFVGNAPHPSDQKRIEVWSRRIRRWADSGLQELYFFIHQREERNTLVLAGELKKMLTALGLPVSL
jgi:uncharacterized protein YecE (DUF72 family)